MTQPFCSLSCFLLYSSTPLFPFPFFPLLHSVRNIAVSWSDSSQMAVVEPHRWCCPCHPPISTTDGSVHLPYFRDQEEAIQHLLINSTPTRHWTQRKLLPHPPSHHQPVIGYPASAYHRDWPVKNACDDFEAAISVLTDDVVILAPEELQAPEVGAELLKLEGELDVLVGFDAV